MFVHVRNAARGGASCDIRVVPVCATTIKVEAGWVANLHPDLPDKLSLGDAREPHKKWPGMLLVACMGDGGDFDTCRKRPSALLAGAWVHGRWCV